MRKPLIIIFLLGFISRGIAQVNDTVYFQNEREMMEFAFQNTDLQNLTDGLFLNYWRDASHVLSVLDTLANIQPIDEDGIYQFADICDRMDINGSMNKSDLMFPLFDHILTLDYERKMKLPIYAFDVRIHSLNSSAFNQTNSWTSENPFPAFSSNDLISTSLFYASIPADTIPYENVSFKFSLANTRTNSGRTLESLDLSVNGTQQTLLDGDEFDLSNYSGDLSVDFTFNFDDGSSIQRTQNLFKANPNQLDKSSFWDFIDNKESIIMNPGEVGINNPELQYAIKYGCNDGEIRKPFFISAGWGPWTDNYNVNEKLEWPSTLLDFAMYTANTEGLVENLNSAGYDVVLMKFYPPNASIIYNSALMEELINEINTEKFSNDSYEENVVMGFSAGALCAKYTLTRMEKKYIENNAPHPHTKLFVSFDGENRGANIPLGLQHHVDYLYKYEHSNNSNKIGAAMYGLNYILNAPLSQELLAYFHTETGNVDYPGQGASPSRQGFLYAENQSNHSFTSGNPNYPAFARNISISNGSSTPDINFNNFLSNHYPYPYETGAIYYRKHGYRLGRFHQWEARFLTHGISPVFTYKRTTGSLKWKIEYSAWTKNPMILDNAPGGIIFIESNPLVAVNDLMNFETLSFGGPQIDNNHLYSFTPTIFTHDIRNYDPFADDNGYLNYNFKDAGLNYDNLFDAQINNPLNSSNTIGYPHLSHPSNHYWITPFDALFTWDENTVHVTSGRKSQSYYEEEWSPARGFIKNFIIDEGEHWNIFLQDDAVGMEHTIYSGGYHADYIAQNNILIGENVTDKKEFKPYTIEPNATVLTMAASEIIVKDGFHVKPQGNWHAKIGEVACTKSLHQSVNNTSTDEENIEEFGESTNQKIRLLVIPNPVKDKCRFLVEDGQRIETNQLFEFELFDLSGNLVKRGSTKNGQELQFSLNPGVYIVKLKYYEKWLTTKYIVQ